MTGASSDETSASLSVSSSDKACDLGTVVVGMGFRANDDGARKPGRSHDRETTAHALPARQIRADSAAESSTNDRALRGRGGAKAARRGRRSPRRVGSDDSDNVAREKSRSPARAGELAIRYSSRGTPR